MRYLLLSFLFMILIACKNDTSNEAKNTPENYASTVDEATIFVEKLIARNNQWESNNPNAEEQMVIERLVSTYCECISKTNFGLYDNAEEIREIMENSEDSEDEKIKKMDKFITAMTLDESCAEFIKPSLLFSYGHQIRDVEAEISKQCSAVRKIHKKLTGNLYKEFEEILANIKEVQSK